MEGLGGASGGQGYLRQDFGVLIGSMESWGNQGGSGVCLGNQGDECNKCSLQGGFWGWGKSGVHEEIRGLGVVNELCERVGGNQEDGGNRQASRVYWGLLGTGGLEGPMRRLWERGSGRVWQD